MIPSIYSDEIAGQLTRNSLEEEGIEVEIGESLLIENSEINSEIIAILKPDGYYCPRKGQKPPPKSVDGVIINKTSRDAYNYYIVELKSSKLTKIRKTDIQEKFHTIFDRMFTIDLKHIFQEIPHDIDSLNLWLVCDPLGVRKKCKDIDTLKKELEQTSNRIKGLMSEYASGLKPIIYRGKVLKIELILSPPTLEIDGYVDLLA